MTEKKTRIEGNCECLHDEKSQVCWELFSCVRQLINVNVSCLFKTRKDHSYETTVRVQKAVGHKKFVFGVCSEKSILLKLIKRNLVFFKIFEKVQLLNKFLD